MFFKNFDYLGQVFGFSYDDSMRYQTNCGGFLSVILGLLSLVVAGWMGIAFFDRTSPIIAGDVTKHVFPPPVLFHDRFNIAIRMTAGSENIFQHLDKVRINLVHNHVHKSNLSNVTSKNISLSPCKVDHFPNQEEMFQQFSLNESLCPDLTNISIQGDFLSTDNTFLTISFEKCVNDPKTGKSNSGTGVICKGEEEIKNFLQSQTVKAHLFFTDTNYRFKDYQNPELSYISNYNLNVYYNTQRESHLYFHISELQSDDTYFFLAPSKRVFKNIVNSNIQERAASRENYMDEFVILNLRADKNVNTASRSYTGFSEIAANIGAILNIVFLFFSGMVFVISRMQFLIRLVNNSIYLAYKNPQYIINLNSDKHETILNVPNDKTKPNQIEFMTSQPAKLEESHSHLNNNTSLHEGKLKLNKIEIINIKDGGETKNTILTKLQNNKDIEKKKKFENVQFLRYDYQKSFVEILFLAFCPCLHICNKKHERDLKVMEYSKKHYYKYTDFFKFLDKFIELNIFKKLVLKKDEADILDIFKRIVMVRKFDIIDVIKPKSDVTLDKSVGSKFKDRLKQKGSFSSDEERLKNYLTSIINKDQRTVVEQNIIDKFDDLFRG